MASGEEGQGEVMEMDQARADAAKEEEAAQNTMPIPMGPDRRPHCTVHDQSGHIPSSSPRLAEPRETPPLHHPSQLMWRM